MSKAQDEIKEMADAIRIQIVHLKVMSTGIATGTIMAVGLFCATNWLVLWGGPDAGPNLQLLSQYFFGYSVTFVGSILGAAYSFGLGFLVGSGVAYMYNSMTTRIRGKQSEK